MKTLKLIKNDPWLAPYKQAIEGRAQSCRGKNFGTNRRNRKPF